MSSIFILLIILHCAGDYYLQTKKLADKKERQYRYVILHSLYYAIPSGLSIFLFDNKNYVFYIAVFCAAHFVVDSIKYFIKSKYFYPKKPIQLKHLGEDERIRKSENMLKVDIVYFIDQLVHIITIIVLAVIFLRNNADIVIKQEILDIFNLDADESIFLLKVIAALAVVLQPVSVTFYKIFNVDLMAEPADSSKDKNSRDIKGTGAIIGYMERIIMMIFLIVGEYAAIGLVLAGKSIARYNSGIKQEFYIIGTFYGICTTVVTYTIFFADIADFIA